MLLLMERVSRRFKGVTDVMSTIVTWVQEWIDLYIKHTHRHRHTHTHTLKIISRDVYSTSFKHTRKGQL